MARAHQRFLRSVAILGSWSLATWVSLGLAGMGRAEQAEASIGAVWFGLVVSLMYAGPLFVVVLALFARAPQVGLRLVVGTWLMTNVLAHGLLAHDDAVARAEIGDCTGLRVFREREWPYDGTTVGCNDGTWFAHD